VGERAFFWKRPGNTGSTTKLQPVVHWKLFLVFCFWFCFLSWVGLGYELTPLHLQSMHFTALATPPVHFVLVILKMGVSQTVSLG
jgi:hypothetical protein